MPPNPTTRHGAQVAAGGVAFSVWAPQPPKVELRLLTGARAGVYPLHRKGEGVSAAFIEGAGPGDRYRFVVGDRERPDPCSRFQPEGVHGPSEVVDPAAFAWRSGLFLGQPLAEFAIYELHVGTFTREGTFDAAISELAGLRELGFTAIELMPVAEFSGGRNWGYDGVDLYAPQSSYGGPDGLRRLVDAAHLAGLAVLLDAVYSHLGPEGNYLREFGPYFTDRQRTPWGDAFDLDGPRARPVREWILQSALAWLSEYRLDGLRLDAVHALHDRSPVHLLRELSDRVAELSRREGRPLLLIAESDENDVRLIQRPSAGGYGMDAVWSDDFHHALHALLTREKQGYYQDYGSVGQLAQAMEHGFAFEGQWSAFRGAAHGTAARHLPADRFVFCAQNHDQVGNRPGGERLSTLVPPEAERLALAALLLSPGTPLVFMGQEYGERAPFHYFTSHEDPALALAVARGRREEFAGFEWASASFDPQSRATFEASKLDRSLARLPAHRGLLRLTADLLALRRRLPALRDSARAGLVADVDERRRLLSIRRGGPGSELLALFSFSAEPMLWEGYIAEGRWGRLLDTADTRYGGPGTTDATLRGGFTEARLAPFEARLYQWQSDG